MTSLPNNNKFDLASAIRLRRLTQHRFSISDANSNTTTQSPTTQAICIVSNNNKSRNNRFSVNDTSRKLSRTFSDSILNKTHLNKSPDVILSYFNFVNTKA